MHELCFLFPHFEVRTYYIAPMCSGTYVGQLYLLFKHEESHTSTVRELMKLVDPMWVAVFAPKKDLRLVLPFDVVLIRQHDQRLWIHRRILRGQEYYTGCRWNTSVN
jgi:hypothetical protein